MLAEYYANAVAPPIWPAMPSKAEQEAVNALAPKWLLEIVNDGNVRRKLLAEANAMLLTLCNDKAEAKVYNLLPAPLSAWPLSFWAEGNYRGYKSIFSERSYLHKKCIKAGFCSVHKTKMYSYFNQMVTTGGKSIYELDMWPYFDLSSTAAHALEVLLISFGRFHPCPFNKLKGNTSLTGTSLLLLSEEKRAMLGAAVYFTALATFNPDVTEPLIKATPCETPADSL